MSVVAGRYPQSHWYIYMLLGADRCFMQSHLSRTCAASCKVALRISQRIPGGDVCIFRHRRISPASTILLQKSVLQSCKTRAAMYVLQEKVAQYCKCTRSGRTRKTSMRTSCRDVFLLAAAQAAQHSAVAADDLSELFQMNERHARQTRILLVAWLTRRLYHEILP